VYLEIDITSTQPAHIS